MATANMKKDNAISDIVEKIAFANYLPLLTRATADYQEVTPGYMYTEIENLSYDYPHHCKQLAAYLCRRLEKPSAFVKLKVLKIMDHIIRQGHVNFRIALRNNDSSLKMSTMHHGVPDPLTGTALYEKIRTNSKELLELLFLPEKIQEDEKLAKETKVRPTKAFLGALGSTSSTEGKYQGFGNSPVAKEESVADKVLNYFDKLSTTSDQNSKIIREGIASCVGKYEAVSMPIQHYPVMELRPMPSLPPAPRSGALKAHVPGRAGGGWEDSDEDDESQKIHHPSVLSVDSLETIEVMPENSAEKELVHQFCTQEKFPVTWNELSDISAGCVKLSGSEVLRAIAEELQTPGTLRALILTDALLHSEIMSTSRSVKEAYQLLSTALAKLSTDTTSPQVEKHKAEKILQILNMGLNANDEKLSNNNFV